MVPTEASISKVAKGSVAGVDAQDHDEAPLPECCGITSCGGGIICCSAASGAASAPASSASIAASGRATSPESGGIPASGGGGGGGTMQVFELASHIPMQQSPSVKHAAPRSLHAHEPALHCIAPQHSARAVQAVPASLQHALSLARSATAAH